MHQVLFSSVGAAVPTIAHSSCSHDVRNGGAGCPGSPVLAEDKPPATATGAGAPSTPGQAPPAPSRAEGSLRHATGAFRIRKGGAAVLRQPGAPPARGPGTAAVSPSRLLLPLRLQLL